MPSIQKSSLYSFNRGIISALALARVDIRRAAIAAAIQQNYWPRVLGPMMLRPGLQRLGGTVSNEPSKFIPFVKATTDTALLEIADNTNVVRPWINDAPVTIPSVSTSNLTNTVFAAGLAGWTINDEAGATSSGGVNGLVQSSTNGFATAIVDQAVTVAGVNIGKEHSLLITVTRGPTILRVGTSTTDDSYIRETALDTGYHFLTFTPTGNFNVRFKSRTRYTTRVSLCTLTNAGADAELRVIGPWDHSDMDFLRWEQSADVLFVASGAVQTGLTIVGRQQQRIERRAPHSWSCVDYKPPDGPFALENTTTTTITPSAIDGDVTLTASAPIWRLGHVGSLWRIRSQGQFVSKVITAQDEWTDPIQITGVGAARAFTASIAGLTATGSTVRLQQSFGVPGNWVFAATPFTVSNAGFVINDSPLLDNQIIFYRLGVRTGEYVAGTITVTLSYSAGSIKGIARIVAFTSATSVDAQVIKALGGTDPTTRWSESQWSNVKGWPSSVSLHEGRLWWSGLNGVWGSVSDAFDSFDEDLVGDAGPLIRTIGSGPVDNVAWMISLQRLILGTQGAEFSCRASAIDDHLTPANFNLKTIANQGSTGVPAQKIDQSGVFVSRTARRAYQLDFGFQFYDYTEKDLTALCPTVLSPGVVRIAVQRQPDTRIHFVLSDGTAVMCVQDPLEEVNAFVTTVTDGTIIDVAVLPAVSGNTDDRVYYLVNRSGIPSLEKFAQESEAQGGTLNKIADSFVVYQGAPATVITGLSHLNGKQVVVWADGQDVGTDDTVVPWTQRYTVSGGQITLAVAASTVIVGLGYTGKFQSVKLGLASGPGSPLNTSKRIAELGLILANTHVKGLQFGQDFTHLDDMPAIEQGRILTPSVTGTYDEQPIEFPGIWTSDERVCLQSIAPRPCTVLALTPTLVAT